MGSKGSKKNKKEDKKGNKKSKLLKKISKKLDQIYDVICKHSKNSKDGIIELHKLETGDEALRTIIETMKQKYTSNDGNNDTIKDESLELENESLELTLEKMKENNNDSKSSQEDNKRKDINPESKINKKEVNSYMGATNNENTMVIKSTKLEQENNELKLALKASEEKNNKIKSGLNCIVCLNYYELPHNLECGHVFCFHCIKDWFLSQIRNDVNLFCPLCRCNIQKVPNFCFILYEQINHQLENNPNNNSLQLLKKVKTSYQMYQDKKQDIWLDIFPKCGIRSTIKDDDDDVERCTNCHWEVVKGVCTNCNNVYTLDDIVPSSSDSDTELSDDNNGDNENENNTSSKRNNDLSLNSILKDNHNDGFLSNSSEGEGELLGYDSMDQSDAEKDIELDTDDESFICNDDEVQYDTGAEDNEDDEDVEVEEIVFNRNKRNNEDNNEDEVIIKRSKKIILDDEDEE
ncbi:hypothetical protein K502DRAFT_367537 [Neoconidiobolus thromboides FSU 785]|nr:hypothetical protein K502DRAFT_367537 [Neoconidiobolus thromboides FSU 785]